MLTFLSLLVGTSHNIDQFLVLLYLQNGHLSNLKSELLVFSIAYLSYSFFMYVINPPLFSVWYKPAESL